MSSSSKSKTTQSTNTTTEDSRVAADGNSIVVTNESNASFVDPGAIALTRDVLNKVIDAAEGVFEFSQETIFDSLGFVQTNVRETNDIVENVAEQQRGEETQLISQVLKFGLPALAIIFILKELK